MTKTRACCVAIISFLMIVSVTSAQERVNGQAILCLSPSALSRYDNLKTIQSDNLGTVNDSLKTFLIQNNITNLERLYSTPSVNTDRFRRAQANAYWILNYNGARITFDHLQNTLNKISMVGIGSMNFSG